MRVDGRQFDDLRPIIITPNPLRHAEGSAMIEIGATKVLCAATIQDNVPPHCFGKGRGWLTAEYSMLPRSSAQRVPRDGARGHVNGRTQEIQRLIGRALRSIFRMDKFGERSVIIDCDVIEADGGTRTASITGAFVALALAMRRLRQEQRVGKNLVTDFLAAVSVGIVEGRPAMDLCCLEDNQAELDMNVVGTGSGRLVEIQGTAEGAPFEREQWNGLIDLAQAGIARLVAAQQEALGTDTLIEAES
jgi:ribonuclease PH